MDRASSNIIESQTAFFCTQRTDITNSKRIGAMYAHLDVLLIDRNPIKFIVRLPSVAHLHFQD